MDGLLQSGRVKSEAFDAVGKAEIGFVYDGGPLEGGLRLALDV